MLLGLCLPQELQDGQLRGGGDGVLWLEDIDRAVRNALVDHQLANRGEQPGVCTVPRPSSVTASVPLPTGPD